MVARTSADALWADDLSRDAAVSVIGDAENFAVTIASDRCDSGLRDNSCSSLTNASARLANVDADLRFCRSICRRSDLGRGRNDQSSARDDCG